MENKAHALAAGIFVVVVAAMLIALASWLTRDTGNRDSYEISTHDTVTGLQSQAPVRYKGVDVGKVDAIGFDPQQQGNVLVHMQVDEAAPITRNTFATLSFQGVTGLAFVQLDDNGQPAPRLQPENGHPPRIPLRPGLLTRLTDRGDAILDKIEGAATNLNQLLGEGNQKRFSATLDNLNAAASDASQLARTINSTMTRRVDPALSQATATLHSAQKTSDQIGRTAADFSAMAQRLNQKNGPMDRLAEGTSSLSNAADSFNSATLPRINRVTDEASRAVRELGRTANNIGDNPQSLLYGNGPVPPGPGEPGFVAPGAAR